MSITQPSDSRTPSEPSERYKAVLIEELIKNGRRVQPLVLVIGQPGRGKRTFVNWMHRDIIIGPESDDPILLISSESPPELSNLPRKFSPSKLSFLIVDDPSKGKPYFNYCHLCICFIKNGDDVSYLPISLPTHYFVPKADLQKQSQCVTEVRQVSSLLSEQLGEFKPVESVGLCPGNKDLEGKGYLLEELPRPDKLTWKGREIENKPAPRKRYHSLNPAKIAAEEALSFAIEREYRAQLVTMTVERNFRWYCAGAPSALAFAIDIWFALLLVLLWLFGVVRYERFLGRIKHAKES